MSNEDKPLVKGEVIIADIIGKGFYEIDGFGDTFVNVKLLKLFGKGIMHRGHITNCSNYPNDIDLKKWNSYKRVKLKFKGITDSTGKDNYIKNMKQSTFRKEVSATGSQGTVNAVIIATMNYSTKSISGTHPSTHDDFSRNIPIHKVEVIINGNIWESELELTSEIMVYNESQRLIKIAQEHCTKLANSEPVETFGDKMTALFS